MWLNTTLIKSATTELIQNAPSPYFDEQMSVLYKLCHVRNTCFKCHGKLEEPNHTF